MQPGQAKAQNPVDPHWSDVKFLSHFDISPIIDETGHTNSSQGPMTIDLTSGNSRFGAGCLVATGSGASFTPRTDDIMALIPGTGDFCIEFQIYRPTLGAVSEPGNNGIILDSRGAAGQFLSGAEYIIWADVGSNTVTAYIQNVTYMFATLPNLNAWHSVALDRNAGTLRGFVDGVMQLEQVVPGSLGSNGNAPIMVGNSSASAGSRGTFNGRLDEFRLTMASRYIDDYTPQSQPWPTGV